MVFDFGHQTIDWKIQLIKANQTQFIPVYEPYRLYQKDLDLYKSISLQVINLFKLPKDRKDSISRWKRISPPRYSPQIC